MLMWKYANGERMHVINTQITTEERDRLVKACRKKGCTVYAFVKDAVLNAVESELGEPRRAKEAMGSNRQFDEGTGRDEGEAKLVQTSIGDYIEYKGKLIKVKK